MQSSPDPHVVFTSLAKLLVPALCDDASIDVILDSRLALWQQNPPADDGILQFRRSPSPPGDCPEGRSITVHVGSLPAESDGWTGDRDYVVALRCTWREETGPVEPTVALVKIVARYAAAVVHQAQQAELIRAQNCRIQQWEEHQ